VTVWDLAIAGGGIVGASALQLASQQFPGQRILLLDRALVGEGTTRYSVGMNLPFGRNPMQRQLSIDSNAMFERWAPYIAALPTRRIPLFAVVSRARADAIIAGFHGDPLRIANAGDEELLFSGHPSLLIGEDQVVLAGSWATAARPETIAAQLVARATTSRHVACWESAEVVAVRDADGSLSITLKDGRDVEARHLLWAVGPWLLDGPAASFVLSRGIRIKKVAALHVDLEPRDRDVSLFFFDEDAFLLPLFEEKRWIFSFMSDEWDVTPSRPESLSISSHDRNLALSILGRYCPPLVPHATGGRVFCDAYAPNWRPFIEPMPDCPRIVIAGACAGSGYRLGPAIAAQALSQFDGGFHARQAVQ
jgi:glycine/D-amino acid oxidase-like deaminating enzyme